MKDEQKFLSWYEKYRKSYYRDNTITIKRYDIWFKQEGLEYRQKKVYVHLIQYTYDICPRIIQSFDTKYMAMIRRILHKKEF
jgi:hypothetical protein